MDIYIFVFRTIETLDRISIYLYLELETLDIYGNLLEEVPEMIFKLETLVRLDLGGMIHINSKAIEDIGEGRVFKLKCVYCF